MTYDNMCKFFNTAMINPEISAYTLASRNIHTNQTSLVKDMLAEPFFHDEDIANHDYDVTVREWWTVTPELAKKLMAKGEQVLTNGYGAWWGRSSNDFPIYLEPVLQQIANES